MNIWRIRVLRSILQSSASPLIPVLGGLLLFAGVIKMAKLFSIARGIMMNELRVTNISSKEQQDDDQFYQL